MLSGLIDWPVKNSSSVDTRKTFQNPADPANFGKKHDLTAFWWISNISCARNPEFIILTDVSNGWIWE